MHLLATTTGVIDGAAEAVDLKQTPADIVIQSAADSELANLARAVDRVWSLLLASNRTPWARRHNSEPGFNALADALAELLKDRSKSIALGGDGQRWVAAQFAVSAMVHHHENLYERLLREAGVSNGRVRMVMA